MTSRANASIAIHSPEPRDFRYWEDTTPGKRAIYFHVHSDAWFVLANERDADSDLLRDALAMRHLAETALEIADKLDARGGRPGARPVDCSPFHSPHSAGCPFCQTAGAR